MRLRIFQMEIRDSLVTRLKVRCVILWQKQNSPYFVDYLSLCRRLRLKIVDWLIWQRRCQRSLTFSSGMNTAAFNHNYCENQRKSKIDNFQKQIDIIPMIYKFLQHVDCQHCGLRETFTQISQDDFGGQVKKPQVCEAVRMNLKIQQNPRKLWTPAR